MLGRLNHSRSRPASPGLAEVGQAFSAVERPLLPLRVCAWPRLPHLRQLGRPLLLFAFAFAFSASAFACSASDLTRPTSSFADFTAASASASFSCAERLGRLGGQCVLLCLLIAFAFGTSVAGFGTEADEADAGGADRNVGEVGVLSPSTGAALECRVRTSRAISRQVSSSVLLILRRSWLA